jgi:hypothetical protein
VQYEVEEYYHLISMPETPLHHNFEPLDPVFHPAFESNILAPQSWEVVCNKMIEQSGTKQIAIWMVCTYSLHTNRISYLHLGVWYSSGGSADHDLLF